jgi:hypothetical protein
VFSLQATHLIEQAQVFHAQPRRLAARTRQVGGERRHETAQLL